MSGGARSGWVHGLARATSAVTLALIGLGGVVTNTGAALAVPDWPTTFGHNLFLVPLSELSGGVLIEHSHRLLGAGVGLLTLGLAVTAWLGDRRGWLRALAACAVVLVCVQGLVGGLRVVHLRDALAMVHGGLAQAFFALTVALAVCTGRRWMGAAGSEGAPGRGPAALAPLTAAVVYGQILLGTLTTHAGWVATHVAGAVVATGAVALLGGRILARPVPDPVLAAWARVLLWSLAVQLGLGLGAYLVRFTGLAVPGGVLAVVGFPVAHRLTGAVLLGSTVALALHLGRRRMGHGRAAGAGRTTLAASGVAA